MSRWGQRLLRSDTGFVAVTHLVAAVLSLATGCASGPSDELPAVPDGGELVLELGELEVYRVFGGDLCEGSLRRIESHTHALADLFEVDPPRARVFIYDDPDALDAECEGAEPRWGCASASGAFARALPSTVTHELVHLFALAATDGMRTLPALEEGLAGRLDGEFTERPSPPLELNSLFAAASGSEVQRGPAAHFVAWAIDTAGMSTVLDAYTGSGGATDVASATAALARALGYASVTALEAEYSETMAFRYPALPDTTRTFSASELAAGVRLETECSSPWTEGPSSFPTPPGMVGDPAEGPALRTRARIEIVQAGEHEVGYEPIPDDLFHLYFRPGEPLVEEPETENLSALWCTLAYDVPHFVFPQPGPFEFAVIHSADVSFAVDLFTRSLGTEGCSPP